MIRPVRTFLLALALVSTAGPALAAACGSSAAGFAGWLEDFKRQAIASGISPGVVASAFAGVTYDSKVIYLDRHQGHFNLSFEQFVAKRAPPSTIALGRSKLQKNAALFAGIEKRYGVPGPILVAIWGLETGFGPNRGNMPVIRSLSTLAYDCRRAAYFRNELMSALKIIQRGDLSPSQMKGAWAGELGQTQFLASSYLKFAVDYDGNGHRDLINSSADALASTANYLKGYGWQRGGPWTEGSHNYEVLRQWNKAGVYVKTIAYFASKISG
ncbi:MAG: lytic murein transglycosylase [Rhizobiales bacterium]|nr:lytic murein transglycosylase [Hyphomicrobiales bacterium]